MKWASYLQKKEKMHFFGIIINFLPPRPNLKLYITTKKNIFVLSKGRKKNPKIAPPGSPSPPGPNHNETRWLASLFSLPFPKKNIWINFWPRKEYDKMVQRKAPWKKKKNKSSIKFFFFPFFWAFKCIFKSPFGPSPLSNGPGAQKGPQKNWKG